MRACFSVFICLCQLCPNLERLKWFRWAKGGKPTILRSFFIVGLHSQLAPDVERWILSQHESHCHNCPKNNLPHAFQVLNVQKRGIWQIVQRFLWHVEDDKHLEHKAKNMLPPHPFMAYGSVTSARCSRHSYQTSFTHFIIFMLYKYKDLYGGTLNKLSSCQTSQVEVVYVKMNFSQILNYFFLRHGSLRCILLYVWDWFTEMFVSLAKCMFLLIQSLSGD